MYISTKLSKIHNEADKGCRSISSDNYCVSAVANVTAVLEEKVLTLPTECLTPLSNSYRPEPDVTAEPKAKGGQYHQNILMC